jgi:hypothetical protein
VRQGQGLGRKQIPCGPPVLRQFHLAESSVAAAGDSKLASFTT